MVPGKGSNNQLNGHKQTNMAALESYSEGGGGGGGGGEGGMESKI